MNQHLTIAFCTSRKYPKIEWFLDSLSREFSVDPKGYYSNPKPIPDVKIIIVSLHELGGEKFCPDGWPQFKITVTKPKPNVWQGEHRLTKEDWFAAANARNTALCLAPDGYIVYADDLSVLLPGWLDRVKAAIDGQYIVCGSYQKVKDLVVENGEVKSFTDYPQGHDSRAQFAKSPLQPCADGGWLFGCSVALPVEALLTIGGWTEFVDGMGSEDQMTGITLQNAGFKLFYDQKMMTYESEELHHTEPALGRTDKGVSPDDKSHRALNIVLSGQKFFDNYYEGGIRTEREKVLRGEPFTIRQIPDRDWFDGELVSEMTPVPKQK
jgi:glycosyltransferase involved in cell wall biosynthesis